MPFGFKLSHRLSLTKPAVDTAAVHARCTVDCSPRRLIHTSHSSVASAAILQRAHVTEQMP